MNTVLFGLARVLRLVGLRGQAQGLVLLAAGRIFDQAERRRTYRKAGQ